MGLITTVFGILYKVKIITVFFYDLSTPGREGLGRVATAVLNCTYFQREEVEDTNIRDVNVRENSTTREENQEKTHLD